MGSQKGDTLVRGQPKVLVSGFNILFISFLVVLSYFLRRTYSFFFVGSKPVLIRRKGKH